MVSSFEDHRGRELVINQSSIVCSFFASFKIFVIKKKGPKLLPNGHDCDCAPEPIARVFHEALG